MVGLGNWLIDNIVRPLFFFLDSLLYGFAAILYDLFTEIAETTIFTEDIIDLFTSKVYTLLGVFMLFKVSFSILTYLVNPDNFLDKSKGFSKLISNIIITLALLILTPFIFSEAMDIQRIILKDNIIGKIFSASEINTSVPEDPGNTMAYETFRAFYHLDTNLFPECEGIETGSFVNEDTCKQNAFNNDEAQFSAAKEVLTYAHKTNSISVYMDLGLLKMRGSNDQSVMYYMPFISTIAGFFLALLLIIFCFDIALRSVKLGFLRMVAPIPIVSRIDPQKGKDTFGKWVKVCLSTYLDLFIRLLAIYFAVFVIGQLTNLHFVDAVTGEVKEVDLFVRVFIIFGALLFAKQLPQLIQDLTGVKLDGKFTLNPMKKLNQTGIPGIAAVGGASLASAVSNFVNAKGKDGEDPTVRRRLASALGGMGSGLVRGGNYFIKNRGENPREIFTKSVTDSSRARRLRESGYGIIDKTMDYFTTIGGAEYDTGTTSKLKNEINHYKELARNARDEEMQARNELRDYRSSLGAEKSEEIQRLLMSRQISVDNFGKVKRFASGHANEGQIEYSIDLPRTYADYVSSGGRTLSQSEYESLLAYTRMIDKADGNAFLAEKKVKKAEEKSGLSKKSN